MTDLWTLHQVRFSERGRTARSVVGTRASCGDKALCNVGSREGASARPMPLSGGTAIGKQSSMRTGEEEDQVGARFHPPPPPSPVTSWGRWNPSHTTAGPAPAPRHTEGQPVSASVCCVCPGCRAHGSGCSAQLPGAARLLLWPASPRAVQERESGEM